MATFKWDTPAAIATLMSTELNSLGSSTGKAIGSTVLDNETDKNRFGSFQLDVTFGSAPTVDTLVELYLVPAIDGTNYADGGASVEPRTPPVAIFPVRAVTTAQVIAALDVPLPPFKVKPLLKNTTNQNFPASGSTLKVRTYNEAST